MELTAFGKIVRLFRTEIGLSLKSMADAVGVSSAHLSSIEFGDKALLPKHLEATTEYFRQRGVSESDIRKIRDAAEQSYDVVKIEKLPPNNRQLVAAFARKLEQGMKPQTDFKEWILKEGEDN